MTETTLIRPEAQATSPKAPASPAAAPTASASSAAAAATTSQRAATGLRWHPVTERLGFGPLLDGFAAGAAERDVTRRAIHAETKALKQHGYGALRLPVAEGGRGITLPELFAVARDLASADPNIAHVFRNHLFAVEQQLAQADNPARRHLLTLVGQGNMLGTSFQEQGNKSAGLVGHLPDMRMHWSEALQAWEVSGVKIYSTGNLYADHILANGHDPATGQEHQFLVSTKAPGVQLDDDWAGFGQKLTGSGTTRFERVVVRREDLFPRPKRVLHPTPHGEAGLFAYTFHQVYLTTVITGIVNRIFSDALTLVHQRSRNYYHGLSERPADEPELQSALGRMAAWRSALNAITERAVNALDEAWQHTDIPQAWELSQQASLAAAEAKVVVDETAAQLASLLFDVASGSGVSTSAALDRHWRNLKVIASHNPRLYKERILGDHYLNGTALPQGAFF